MKLGLVAAAFITFLGALVLIIVIGTNARAAPAPKPQQPAQQQNCASLEQVRKDLAENYGQLELNGGMHSASTEDDPLTVIFFVRPDRRSWSQWIVGNDKQACFVMGGTSWFQGSLPVIGPKWEHI